MAVVMGTKWLIPSRPAPLFKPFVSPGIVHNVRSLSRCAHCNETNADTLRKVRMFNFRANVTNGHVLGLCSSSFLNSDGSSSAGSDGWCWARGVGCCLLFPAAFGSCSQPSSIAKSKTF